MKKIISFLFLFFIGFTQAQQLNCTVQVNAEKLGSTNNQIFKTLEKSITEFVNKTDWTGMSLAQNEKINCSMVIIVNSYESDQFSATLQVQSSRPVFNSTYSTPVFNYFDKDFSFRYVEFENLIYNPSVFESNLVSVVSYYCYMILGFDADTFMYKGGGSAFQVAQQIASVAQQSGYKGWGQTDGNQNRYFLINDVLSGTFEPYRQAMFQYHKEGLDTMHADLKIAKEKIITSINTLSKINSVRPNAFMTRIFFDAKADEIVSILSGGPSIPIADTVEKLNKISPINSSKWTSIKL